MSELLDTPVVIVTAFDGERGAGCLVGFWTQCSIDPPRYLVCLSQANYTHGVAARSAVLAVHLVPDDRFDLAELFGGETGDEVDKLARCDWTPGPAGVPILDGCPDWFVGREVARVGAGDHDAVVLEPVNLSAGEPAGPFVHYRRAEQIDPGHPA
jgi:flavin reductase (DIM6/NTAB) family NADH-FMN oxidoreductase RutF